MGRNTVSGPCIARRAAAWLVTFVCLAASPPGHAQAYGLGSRAPIGPYLDDRFPATAPDPGTGWSTAIAFPNLTFRDPTFLVPEPNSNRLCVGTLWGIVYRIVNDPETSARTVFLDVSDRTQVSDSSGLLGLAFHPEFGAPGSSNRGYVYVAYQYSPNPVYGYQPSWNRLSRFTVPDGAAAADPGSELVLIDQFDPEPWHNGGDLFFGDDGFLYLSAGDGGGANDSFGFSQKLDGGFFGGVLRIDVDMDPARSHPIRRQPRSSSPSMPSFSGNYTIPNDNPFLDPSGGTLEEFWAIGLRSPHRMTHDPIGRRIWVGDVGQTTVEEIDVIEKGRNYQWPYREASVQGPKPKPSPLIGVDQPPVFSYPVGDGNNCVIGGYVYRGREHAALLDGKYIFGDNGSGRIWALTYDAGAPTATLLCSMPPGTALTGLSSFGVDHDGELYLCQMGPEGRILKLARSGASGPNPPALLSQTGAFTDVATLTPAPGLVPYDVNSPLWSDGAAKRRWIAVPNDGAPYGPEETIGFSRTGHWTFPAGTVFVKHFELPVDDTDPTIVRRLETRFLVRDADGGAYGITYKWRADGSDADLLPGSLNEEVAIRTAGGGSRTQTWSYPSPQSCLSCHTPGARHVLGASTRQLNGEFTYPSSGVTDNQLRTLNRLGLLRPALNESDIPGLDRLVPVDDPVASLELRVRSYLDANCAHCHRPGGARAFFDARFDTPLAQQQIIDGPVANALGIEDAHVVTPASVERSVMHRRIETNEGIRMPPLARNVVDLAAVETLEEWIRSLRPSAVPAPWANADVGFVNLAGAVSHSDGTFTVNGSGHDISGNADAFHFAHQPWTGDGEIVARLTGLQNTDTWAKGGVMFRETLEAGSRNVFVASNPGGAVLFQQRTVTGGSSSSISGFASLPRWLRLVRTGSTFRGYHSSDGVNWTQLGSATLALPETIYVGLAVTSHQNGTLCAGTFTGVGVSGPGGPPPPPAAPTTLAATAASSSRIDLAWTDNASNETGFRIERASSGGAFAEIATVGADVTTYTSTGLAAATAYSYRVRASGSSGDSAYSNTASTTTAAASPSLAAPSNLTATAISASRIDLAWTDNSAGEEAFAIERSADGVSFTPIATTAANATAYANTGLAASSTYTYRVRATLGSTSSAFSNSASATPPPSSWTSLDIGNVALAGSDDASGGTITVRASGTDIWETVDGFRFLYRALDGDGSIIARVQSLANTDGWAKAGVMIRESLSAGAANVAALITAANGAVAQHRTATGGSTSSARGPWGVAAPYWIRLVRTGNTIVASGSADGAAWTTIATYTTSFGSTAFIGLAVTSHNNAARTTAVFDGIAVDAGGSTPPPSPPAAPADLVATAVSASAIDLAWTDHATDETGFKIERSAAGGAFAQIAIAPAGVASFSDTGLAAATAYTYRVRATNAAGDSAFSNTAGATTSAASPPPPPPPPPDWTGADVGDTALAGSHEISGGTFTLRGSGNDIWNTADGFRFLYRTLAGDASITARVVSLSNTHGWAKAGVMIRESLAAGSRNAAALVTPANGIVAQSRSSAGGTTSSIGGPWGVSPPYWVRLERTGNTIVASSSRDGVSWNPVGTFAVDLGATAHVGLVVSAHNNGALATAVFDNVSATGSSGSSTPPPAPTGLTATAASATRIDLAWTDNAANEEGFGIERATDGITFTPHATVAANVTSYASTGLAASTTYTYRVRALHGAGNSAYSNSASATTLAAPASPPAAPSNLTATAASSSQVNLSWTDHASNETGFAIERSSAGTSFTQIATVAANLTTYANTGLAASTAYAYRVRATGSGGNSPYSNTANATTPAAPGPPAPTWSHADIGPVGLAGSDDASGNTITVRGSGADIWDTADAFRFLYRTLSGDCTIEAQVTSLTNTHAWAKAGVMIRDDLTPGARNVFALLTPNNGLAVQNRATPGGTTAFAPGPWGIAAPHWVRLQRTGNTIVTSASPNGTTWTTIATHTVAMDATVHVGFAVTSHNNAALNTAVFTDPFIEP